jgi:hypothetical protein
VGSSVHRPLEQRRRCQCRWICEGMEKRRLSGWLTILAATICGPQPPGGGCGDLGAPQLDVCAWFQVLFVYVESQLLY